MTTVSVLMATYVRETGANLAAALESMYGQTVPPDQVVLVVDGPVRDDQEAVIGAYALDTRVGCLDVVRLSEGVGLAGALNAGLERCTGAFIARMDSDDISMPNRLERQLAYVQADPSLDAIGSWSEEFFDDGTPSQLKICPMGHDAIVNALRWRNVLVHPSMLIRTETLRAVGGYRTKFGKLEDYDLFVRLALSGARFRAVPKALLRVRSSIEQRTRRGGISYAMHEFRFRADLFRRGFLGLTQFIVSTTLYVAFRAIPSGARRRLYAVARR